ADAPEAGEDERGPGALRAGAPALPRGEAPGRDHGVEGGTRVRPRSREREEEHRPGRAPAEEPPAAPATAAAEEADDPLGAGLAPEDRHEVLDDLGVELRAGALLEALRGLLGRQRPPVWAVVRHRLVGLGDQDDS